MKKLQLILVFSLLGMFTFTSCYKEDFSPNDSDNSSNIIDQIGNIFSNGDGKVVAIYEVDGEALIELETKNAKEDWMEEEARHQEMWEHFLKMTTPDDRRWIKEFEVFDGRGDLYGYVEPQYENDLSLWRFALGVDIAYPNGVFDGDGEYTYTVIHEYAHIFSLNETQIKLDYNNCSNYENEEGCTLSDSYMNLFYQQFWTAIYDEYEAAYNSGDEDAFYDKYQDHFVTDYAATNPEEDLAEAFTFFVTSDNIPNGNKVKDKKVRFFQEFPEMVQLREQMREASALLPNPGSWKRAKQFKLHPKYDQRIASTQVN